MPLVLGTINLLCKSLSEQLLSHQTLLLEQEAQVALGAIAGVVQLAGYRGTRAASDIDVKPRVFGLDDASLAARSDMSSDKSGPGLLGSDVIMVRYAGVDTAGNAPLNCAGMPVPAGADDQGSSVFYVARGPNGEGELRCKYRTASGWDSEALLQGVESFQALYGLDRDGDGLPEQYQRASAIAAEIGSGKSGATLWNQIVAVKIALLMRSTRRVQQTVLPERWDLFGDDYSELHKNQDRGVRLSVKDFPAELQHRLRRTYEQVIFIRNPSRTAEEK